MSRHAFGRPTPSGRVRRQPTTGRARCPEHDEGASRIATGHALDSAEVVECTDPTQHAALAASAGMGWRRAPLDSRQLTVGGAMQGESFALAVPTADGRRSAYADTRRGREAHGAHRRLRRDAAVPVGAGGTLGDARLECDERFRARFAPVTGAGVP